MKTRSTWAAGVKFATVTILVSSLLVFGVLRSAGKHTHATGVGPTPVTANASASQPRTKSDPEWRNAYGKLPLSFEENVGQTAQEVRFVSHGTGYGLFLTSQEAVISLQQSMAMNLSPLHRTAYFRALRKSRQAGRMTVLRMRLEGANPAAQIAGIDRLPGKVNYFIGNDPKNWRTDVPSYARVKYAGIYPGVDLVFYGNQRRLEYDFVVAPGADPKVIELSLKGAQKLRVNSNGDLVLSVSGGQVALQRPLIYQNVNGGRREIQGRYVLAGDRRVTFAVASYDRSAPLIIDPVLNYSTYLGGSASPNGDSASSIAVDSLGDAFVTGTTFSTTFPSTPGGFGAGNVLGVAFVTEINPIGTALLYTTYLGGTGGDFGFGIALDNSGNGTNPGGNVYVTGETFSSDFPTNGSIAPLKPGPNVPAATLGTSFISKLNPAASGPGSLVYSSYLGGTNGTSTVPDVGNAVAADANGNAYVTGFTSASPGSVLANFPITTASAFQTVLGTSDGNAFLTRIDTMQSGSNSLAYSTYLGGSGANAISSGLNFGEQAQGVAVDSSKNAYIIGTTTSSDFPTTNANAFQPNTAPPAAVAKGTVFISRIDTSTTKTPIASLVYSTYLGGESQDLSAAIALKPNSAVAYVTGETISLLFPSFPTAPPGPYQKTGAVGGVAFVSLIDTGQIGNASLIYSTFLGGAQTTGFGIAVDAPGNAYIVGGTSDTAYPVTPGAFQPKFDAGAKGEGFISKLNPGGKGTADLVYSSFFGGSGSAGGPDAVNSIVVDNQNDAYITGVAFSSSATFPVFPAGAFQTNLPAGDLSAAFVTKLTLIPTLTIVPAPGSTIDFGTVKIGNTSAAMTVTLTNNTNASIAFASAALSGTNKADYAVTTAGCSPNIVVGTPCVVSIKFTPTVVAPPSEVATLTITDGDSTSPQVFNLTGKGTNTSPDFTLTGPAATPSSNVGTPLNFAVTVTPIGGFNSAVTFTCTSTPTLVLGTCNATTVTPDGVNPINSTVTVTSTAFIVPPPGPRIPPPSIRQIVPLVLALLLLFLLPTARRLRVRLGMGTAMILFLVLAGCSGGQAPHTAKGNYTLTITGTSGTLNHAVMVPITLK
jgi:hypothetical protein